MKAERYKLYEDAAIRDGTRWIADSTGGGMDGCERMVERANAYDRLHAMLAEIAEARCKDGERIGELRAALTKIAMGAGMPQHVEESLADAEIRQLARDVLERTKP